MEWWYLSDEWGVIDFLDPNSPLFLYRILSLLYILRGFKKLIIVFLTFKNTLNLINLFLFLKHKNEIKTINWQKLKTKTYQCL